VASQVVFRTQGEATSYLNTTNSVPVFVTSGEATSFLSTFSPTSIFLTGGLRESFLTTSVNFPTFITASESVAFFATADKNTAKLLKPKIGDIGVASGYTYILVPDNTGDYNEETNQGGYNILPLPYNAARPYRTNVALWTVYRIWNKSGNQTISPDEQNEQYDVNYEYQLFIPTETDDNGVEDIIRGIYQIILIAAPYFNESNSGGLYLQNSLTESTGYIVKGTNTTFTDAAENDYLYFVDGTTGNLVLIEQILKRFSDTTIGLIAAAQNQPAADTFPKLYASTASVSVNPSSGVVTDLTTGIYYNVFGTGTDFSNFSQDEYIYYIDSLTNEYVYLGQFFIIVNTGQFNLYNKSENPSPIFGDYILSSASELSGVVNSNGTYDTNVGTSFFGIGTDFTKFTEGQTLYYQDAATGLLYDIAVIGAIISATELTIQSLPVNFPSSGDRLYASNDAIIQLISSGGVFDNISGENTYYSLTATGASFNTFSPADYIYIVSPEGVYNELGQMLRVESNDVINFYNVQSIEVNEGDFAISSGATPLSLIDLEGNFDEYFTQGYYDLIGSGTQFLTTAEPEQFVYYIDAVSGLYVNIGQVFQVYDNSTLWLYDVMTGSPDLTSTLYTSYTQNTETANYLDYRGIADLYEIANQFPGWYVGSSGLLVDEFVINCLSQMRYAFLQSIMCGRCDEEYLNAYSVYVGIINAMEAGEWERAVEFYDKLKGICTEQNCNQCGC